MLNSFVALEIIIKTSYALGIMLPVCLEWSGVCYGLQYPLTTQPVVGEPILHRFILKRMKRRAW